jgi:hypothetical protein
MGAHRRGMASAMIDALQSRIARRFFDLPESEGYVVGGGVAVLAHGIVERPTEDLDLFLDRRRVGTRPLGAADSLRRALIDERLGVRWIREYEDHATLGVSHGAATTKVDLVLESLDDEAVMTDVGPTVSVRDSAVGKLIALFDRAEARDFVDVHAHLRVLDRDELLDAARARDAGLDPAMLAERFLRLIDYFVEEDLPPGHAGALGELRSYYREWREVLLGRR